MKKQGGVFHKLVGEKKMLLCLLNTERYCNLRLGKRIIFSQKWFVSAALLMSPVDTGGRSPSV